MAHEEHRITSEVDLQIVCATFDARAEHERELAAALARWVVMTRTRAGCRNVDLLASATRPGRLRIIEKWEDPAAMQAHLDSQQTATAARELLPLLATPPVFELYDGISAHDLI